jgi:hypothetical protein
MTTGDKIRSLYWTGLTASILAGLIVTCMPTRSQQATDRGAVQVQSQSAKKATKAATAKPAGGKSTGAGSIDMRAPQTRQWTIEDALPSRSRTREPAIVSSPGLGRVPVEGGTFGVSTDQQVDPYRTPDGNRIRGMESTSKSDPSYLGLSLSVQNENKGFVPRSILPNW